MKRLFSLTLILVLALSMMSSMASADTVDWEIEEGAKLTAWVRGTFTPEADEAWKSHWEQVAADAGIKLEVVIFNGQDQVEMYNAALESGNIPDIMFMGSAICSGFLANDLFLPLNDMVEKIEQSNNVHFFDSMLDYWTIDGNIYTVPSVAESRVLIYRTDILAEAGYDHAPETWKELREIAKAVTDPEKGIYGFGEPFGSCFDCITNQSLSMLWAWDACEIDAEGKVAINSQNTLDLINFLYEMYAVDGSIPPSAIGWDDSGNNTAYLSGQCAMVINPPTVITALKTGGLDDILANTALAVLPAGPNGTRTAQSGTQNMAIYSGTKYPNAAQYILASYYDYEFYNEWMLNVSPVWAPVFEEMANEPFWQEGMNAVNIETAAIGHQAGWPLEVVDLNYSAWQANFEWSTMMQEVLVNGVDPQTALDNLEAKMISYFGE